MKKTIGALAVFSVLFFSIPQTNASGAYTLLGSTTLGSAAVTMTVSALPASEDLYVVVNSVGLSDLDHIAVQFNSDTAANYGRRIFTSFASVANSNQASNVQVTAGQGAGAQDFTLQMNIHNPSATAKRGTFSFNRANLSGDDYAPANDYEGLFSWKNTSAQISSITVFTVGATVTFGVGSKISVYGWDSSVSYASLPANATGLLKNDGSGSLSWDSASTTKTFLSLNNVENTALSTWTGSTAITTLGTIGTGVWNGTVVTVPYGGTSLSTISAGSFMRGNGTSAPSLLAPSASATERQQPQYRSQ